MTSISTLGQTAITIQFDLNRNIDGAAADVLAAINAAGGQLPKDLPSPPTYRKVNPAGLADFVAGGDIRHTAADRGRQLRRDKAGAADQSDLGVGQVLVGGQQKPAVRIQLDPAKLVAKGVSLEDVRAQCRWRRRTGRKGRIEGTQRAFTIYTNDQLTAAKPWNDVIVSYHNQGPLRVRDIGQAVNGAQDTTQAGWADGNAAYFW